MIEDHGSAAVTDRALELVTDGCRLGLGTGRAAAAFVRALAARVRAGLHVRTVATSRATAALARELRVPLASLDDITELDLAVDGADEVDPALDLIKGYGGALVRERIVAAAARRLVILIQREKLVPALGARGRLPVEVVPFGLGFCARRLEALGCRPAARQSAGHLFVSDNGNNVLDCGIGILRNPAELEREIRSIPGVVGTGLFLGLADIVFVEDGGNVTVLRK